MNILHRGRAASLMTCGALLSLMPLAPPVHAQWGVQPVEVHATAAHCPVVSVAGDGRGGAFVVWQEASPNGGLLKARRIKASGELAFPLEGPELLSTADITRSSMGVVSDGFGGAFVWWVEGASPLFGPLFLTHIRSDGRRNGWWSTRGRLMGGILAHGASPSAAPDGMGGLFIAYLEGHAPLPVPQAHIRLQRLMSTNAAPAGWPIGGVELGLEAGVAPTVISTSMDQSGDGGVWVAWQTVELVGPEPSDGDLRLVRLTAEGLPAEGWTYEGVLLEPHPAEFIRQSFDSWPYAPAFAQVTVVHDVAFGSYVLASRIWQDPTDPFACQQILRRLDASGATVPGWPVQGVEVDRLQISGPLDLDESTSPRAFSDGRGGIYTGVPEFATDSPIVMEFKHRDPSGSSTPGGRIGVLEGLEAVARGDGGMFAAWFKPEGANSVWDWDAHVTVVQSSPGAGFHETKRSSFAIRYGDVGLAATGDGGAIFAWSQLIDRQGIYAIRLNPAGQVVGVTPMPRLVPLHVRFERGRGVQVSGGARRVRLTLHDLSGREVARGEAEWAGDWTVPGTAGLASGMYFARTVADGTEGNWKVLVLR